MPDEGLKQEIIKLSPVPEPDKSAPPGSLGMSISSSTGMKGLRICQPSKGQYEWTNIGIFNSGSTILSESRDTESLVKASLSVSGTGTGFTASGGMSFSEAFNRRFSHISFVRWFSVRTWSCELLEPIWAWQRGKSPSQTESGDFENPRASFPSQDRKGNYPREARLE